MRGARWCDLRRSIDPQRRTVMLELAAAVAESLEVSDMEARALVGAALEQEEDE